MLADTVSVNYLLLSGRSGTDVVPDIYIHYLFCYINHK